MNQNGLILIGMPGCGKSTVGKLLARALSLPFYDTDTVFESAVGQSPAEFLSLHTEREFREQEMHPTHTSVGEGLAPPAKTATIRTKPTH